MVFISVIETLLYKLYVAEFLIHLLFLIYPRETKECNDIPQSLVITFFPFLLYNYEAWCFLIATHII